MYRKNRPEKKVNITLKCQICIILQKSMYKKITSLLNINSIPNYLHFIPQVNMLCHRHSKGRILLMLS